VKVLRVLSLVWARMWSALQGHGWKVPLLSMFGGIAAGGVVGELMRAKAVPGSVGFALSLAAYLVFYAVVYVALARRERRLVRGGR